MSEEDNELKKLLAELEKVEPIDTSKLPKSGKKKGKSDGMIEIKPLVRPTPKLVDDDILEDEEKLPSADDFQQQFYSLLAKYHPITDDIIKTYKKDRQQAQMILDHFVDALAAGGRIPRVYIEKIADILKAKNDISQVPIRMLDSIAKLMSAAKGSDVLQQVNMSFDSSQLAKLLETGRYEDEGKLS